MADEAEDVLELEDAIEDQLEDDQDEKAPEPENEDEEDEQSETFIGFEGEEGAAPAPEGESSVIREMRQKIREKDKELAELRRANQPPKTEVGEEPTLEGCEYDEDRFKAEWSNWTARKARAEAEEAEARKANEAQRAEWETRAKAYESDKVTLGVADYEEAEAEVFSALPSETQALILMTDKPAALVYALSRNPAKVDELSKLNLARAAMMIGKMEDKVTVRKGKKPSPDTPVRGKTTSGGDKELARLEQEALRTGDRTALIRYRKEQKAQA